MWTLWARTSLNSQSRVSDLYSRFRKVTAIGSLHKVTATKSCVLEITLARQDAELQTFGGAWQVAITTPPQGGLSRAENHMAPISVEAKITSEIAIIPLPLCLVLCMVPEAVRHQCLFGEPSAARLVFRTWPEVGWHPSQVEQRLSALLMFCTGPEAAGHLPPCHRGELKVSQCHL